MTTGRTFDWFDWTYEAQESSNIISQNVNKSTTLIIYCCLFFFSFVEIRKNYVLFEMKLENDLFRHSHHILRFSLAIVYLNTYIYWYLMWRVILSIPVFSVWCQSNLVFQAIASLIKIAWFACPYRWLIHWNKSCCILTVVFVQIWPRRCCDDTATELRRFCSRILNNDEIGSTTKIYTAAEWS